jgi:hypothetical protein
MEIRKDFNIVQSVNKSDIYILPMLVDLENILRSDNRFPQCLFRKTFLGDKSENSEYKENKILLLYELPNQKNKTNILSWTNFEKFLCNLPTYVTDYKADKYHRIYVYDVPDMWKDDYNLFLEWKPSKFSELYKQKIKQFYNNIGMDHSVMGVLYKTEQRFKEIEEKYGISIPRSQEASSIPYWGEEYYQDVYKIQNSIKPNLNFDKSIQ